MNKTYRQGQILRLIKAHKILTQEMLAKELAAVGVSAKQVTLSRDMRELGLVKTTEGYRQVEAGAIGPGIETVMAEYLHEVRVAQNLLVLRTSPGNANSIAAALDQEDWPEVVGTIAGDDTILVIAPDGATAMALQKRFVAFLEV